MAKKAINATHYERIPAYASEEKRCAGVVNAIIETPKNSPHKYALRNDYGIIAFHEVLPDSMHWPFDYGFVPNTLADDGDPLDILVLCEQKLFPGCFIEARVIGSALERKDGVENDRLIAVPLSSPGAPQLTDQFDDIGDVPRTLVRNILTFLEDYSKRQGHTTEVLGTCGVRQARASVDRAAKKYRKRH